MKSGDQRIAYTIAVPPSSILVIDDSPEALALYKELLELDGYLVHAASSLATARQAVRAHQPSIVVIDDDPEGIRAERIAQEIARVVELNGFGRPLYIAIRGDMVLDELDDLPHFDQLLLKPLNFEELDAIIKDSVKKRLLP